MSTDLNKFLEKTRECIRLTPDFSMLKIRPRLITKDKKLHLSVQASRVHYSKPKDDKGPYTHVEVGYPNIDPPPAWEKYADDPTTRKTVYGYIPIGLVEKWIDEHGALIGNPH